MVHPEKQNDIGVNKALCKSQGGSVNRNITDMESISGVSVYSNKGKFLLFPWWKWSTVINLPSGWYLLTLRNGAKSILVSAASNLGTQQWRSSGKPWWVQVFLAGSMPDFHPLHIVPLFLSLLDRRDWERVLLESTKQVILATWLFRSSSAYINLWQTFAWDRNIFIVCVCSGRPTHMLPPQIPLPCFPTVFRFPDHQAKSLEKICKSTKNHLSF